MKFNALMHVNIRVKDWDKMVDFYQNKLGLKVKVIVRNICTVTIVQQKKKLRKKPLKK